MGRQPKKTPLQQTKQIINKSLARLRKRMRDDEDFVPTPNMINALMNYNKTIAVIEGSIGDEQIKLDLREIMKRAKKSTESDLLA